MTSEADTHGLVKWGCAFRNKCWNLRHLPCWLLVHTIHF